MAICRLTPQALGAPNIDRNYYQCWVGLKSHFNPDPDRGPSLAPPADSGQAVSGGKQQNGAL